MVVLRRWSKSTQGSAAQRTQCGVRACMPPCIVSFHFKPKVSVITHHITSVRPCSFGLRERRCTHDDCLADNVHLACSSGAHLIAIIRRWSVILVDQSETAETTIIVSREVLPLRVAAIALPTSRVQKFRSKCQRPSLD
jgi:hypothetical protein